MRLSEATRIVIRVAAAALVYIASLSVYTSLEWLTHLSMFYILTPVIPLQLAALLLAAATLLGSTTFVILALGVPAALVVALGLYAEHAWYAILAVAAMYIIERRLAVNKDAGISVENRRCGLACKASIAVNMLVFAASVYAAYKLSWSLGASIGSMVEGLAYRAPGALAPLTRILVGILAVRLVLFALAAWSLYKLFTSIAEPLVYALLASPTDAAALVDRLVEAEREKLAKGEAWHQKLLRSSIASLFALLSIPLVYSIADTLVSLYTEIIGFNPMLAKALNTLYTASPALTIVTYIIAKRILGRLASRLTSLRVEPPSAKPWILLAALATALAVYLAGPVGTLHMLYSTLTCPFTGSCGVEEPGRLLEIGSRISQALSQAARGAAGIARLINALIVEAFQG